MAFIQQRVYKDRGDRGGRDTLLQGPQDLGTGSKVPQHSQGSQDLGPATQGSQDLGPATQGLKPGSQDLDTGSQEPTGIGEWLQ